MQAETQKIWDENLIIKDLKIGHANEMLERKISNVTSEELKI